MGRDIACSVPAQQVTSAFNFLSTPSDCRSYCLFLIYVKGLCHFKFLQNSHFVDLSVQSSRFAAFVLNTTNKICCTFWYFSRQMFLLQDCSWLLVLFSIEINGGMECSEPFVHSGVHLRVSQNWCYLVTCQSASPTSDP